MTGKVIEGDRPSKHGAILGEALALIADLGERDARMDNWRDRCATCAFRKGTAPNMTAGTGIVALNCVLGVDRDRFACHHGMEDGQPKKICVGYIAARIAPFSSVKEVMALLHSEMGEGDADDPVRAAFDAWLQEIDPEGKMDVYQVARAYQRRVA